MRVLWFADAQLPEVTGSPRAGGGWVEGLRSALERFAPEIELGIASPGAFVHEPFSAGNATYFHVAHGSPDGRIPRAMRRWSHSPVPINGIAGCAEIARSFAPDVVHIHGVEHYFGLVIPFLAAPAAISVQGIAAACERYSFSGLGLRDIAREIPTRSFLHGDGLLHGHWSMHYRAKVERQILRSCEEYMGRTEWDKGVIRLLQPSARYHEVGEVMSEPFYGPRWSGSRTGDDVLYCTGGASALKGVECLLEALILLRRAGLRRPRLRLSGGVLDGLMARKVSSLLAAPELQDAVDVLGTCTPAQIAVELSNASAFVLPSHMDNSSNSLCEAMLVGAPCIASFVGGIPSLVRDGAEGLLYNDSDPFALAGKIDRLLGDPALAARLGANARETARRRHDPETVAGQAVDAYGSVLERWRRRRAERGTAETRKGAP